MVWANPFSSSLSFEEKLFFWLRFGVLGCFVGHGSWGIITKTGWLPFFEVYFINAQTAFSFMPIIGVMDILVGILVFLFPNRPLLIWAAFWTLFTALLRPSAGMGMSEFFERAGNYGVPIAFLALYGMPRKKEDWFEILRPLSSVSAPSLRTFELILRLSLFSLLAGHGSLALFKMSPLIHTHLNYLGFDITLSQLQLFGLFEIGLGLLVLLWPRLTGLLIFILVWKLSTELIFPFAGKPIDILETIERMGDYVIPVILMLVYSRERKLI